uniref:C-type lectin domain-containing protein n=1 Tax=Neogobius melanostomus TaxID=47308 RepID=A0A8C6SNZ2_9GOBI
LFMFIFFTFFYWVSVHVFKGSSGGRKQYFYISTSKSWEDARYHCRQHHTDLAMIEDESENTAVASVLVPNHWAWIGLYRQAWRWSDDSDSQFKNWRSGQPDNYGNEHCAWEHYHKWDDAPCSSKRKFVSPCLTPPPFPFVSVSMETAINPSKS